MTNILYKKNNVVNVRVHTHGNHTKHASELVAWPQNRCTNNCYSYSDSINSSQPATHTFGMGFNIYISNICCGMRRMTKYQHTNGIQRVNCFKMLSENTEINLPNYIGSMFVQSKFCEALCAECTVLGRRLWNIIITIKGKVTTSVQQQQERLYVEKFIELTRTWRHCNGNESHMRHAQRSTYTSHRCHCDKLFNWMKFGTICFNSTMTHLSCLTIRAFSQQYVLHSNLAFTYTTFYGALPYSNWHSNKLPLQISKTETSKRIEMYLIVWYRLRNKLYSLYQYSIVNSAGESQITVDEGNRRSNRDYFRSRLTGIRNNGNPIVYPNKCLKLGFLVIEI